jgi:hypothetical protein
MSKAPAVTEATPHLSKANQWMLPRIYHYVLARSDSPEAAKIVISDARRSSKLHLWGERREHKARPDLKRKAAAAVTGHRAVSSATFSQFLTLGLGTRLRHIARS